MTSPKARLALAIRRTNAAYGALPDGIRESVEIGSIVALEAAVDTALAAGDDLAAIRGIEAWEAQALRTFAEAAK